MSNSAFNNSISGTRPLSGWPAPTKAEGSDKEAKTEAPAPVDQAIQDTLAPGRPAARMTAPLAFVDSAVEAPTTSATEARALNFPDAPLKIAKFLSPYAQIKESIVELGVEKDVSQAIEHNTAALALLTNIQTSMSIGMSLEEAFQTHFRAADLEGLLSADSSGQSPQETLRQLTARVEEQRTALNKALEHPQTYPMQQLRENKGQTALELANHVLDLTTELDAQSAKVENLTEASKAGREKATATATEIETLKAEDTAEQQEYSFLTGYVRRFAGLVLKQGAASAPAAADSAPADSGQTQLPTPAIQDKMVKVLGISVSLVAGRPMILIGGRLASQQELAAYLARKQEEEQLRHAAKVQVIDAKQADLSRQHQELGKLEVTLGQARADAAFTAEQLRRTREELLQHPDAAQLPGYAALLARAAAALDRNDKVQQLADRELAALRASLDKIAGLLNSANQARQSKPAAQKDEAAREKEAPAPASGPAGGPGQLQRNQGWSPLFMEQVRSLNQGINRRQADALLAQLLDQLSINLHLLRRAREAGYHQQKLAAMASSAAAKAAIPA